MIYNHSAKRARQPPPPALDDYSSLGEYGHLASGDPYAAAASRTAVPLPNLYAQPSPPASQHPSGSTDNSLMSRPSTNRSVSAANSHLSTASSLSRASDGHNFYSPTTSEFGRGPPSATMGKEEVLYRHHNVLKGFLAPYLKDEAGHTRPTRARDKLLRLSPTQFHELSTDVYDEFLRREDDRRRPGGSVPPYLPPKQTFHPKRNQARQKLSTLPPDRFRQLATDVFYELERRIPRLGVGDMDRPGSAAGSFTSQGSRQLGPNGTMRGPPYRGPAPPGMRPGPGGHNHYPSQSQDGPPPRFDSRSRSGSVAQTSPIDVRPVPQTTQSSTIVPNKSTIVEDDETDDDSLGLIDRGSMGSAGSKDQRLREYEVQVSEMQERIHELEGRLQSAESRQPEDEIARERDEWTATKADLEARLAASQQSFEDLHEELELSHSQRNESENHLRAALSDLQLEIDEVRQENSSLRESGQQIQHSRDPSTSSTQLAEELAAQRALTDEVRRNAQTFLQEMRVLSEQSDLALEKEEELRRQIASLEQESEHWKTRYTKARTQVWSLRASSLGLGIQHDADRTLRSRHSPSCEDNALFRADGTGLVPDVAVSAYQISIDELLIAARDPHDPERALEKAKHVIRAVRAIVSDIDGDVNGGMHSGSSSPVPTTVNGSTARGSSSVNGHPVALKARITRDANRLVTAARTHAMAGGVAPVSLLDAAASNLTASVVVLLRTVGVRRSEEEDLGHEGEDVDYGRDTVEYRGKTVEYGGSHVGLGGEAQQLQPLTFGRFDTSTTSTSQTTAFDTTADMNGGFTFADEQRPLFHHSAYEQNEAHDQGRAQQQDQEPQKQAAVAGSLGGGWFNMLKSPTLSNKDSMAEGDSEGESEDERYGYA